MEEITIQQERESEEHNRLSKEASRRYNDLKVLNQEVIQAQIDEALRINCASNAQESENNTENQVMHEELHKVQNDNKDLALKVLSLNCSNLYI